MIAAQNRIFTIAKTVIDYSIAIVSLIVLAPLILVLLFLIRVTSKGPVIYSQDRLGKDGKPFRLYKLRSMKHTKFDGIPLLSGKNDTRITMVGRFMRKHKLDEIPNFLNVLRGEMSLIGPRPEQKYFADQIIERKPEYLRLQSIKPGITSWGQVRYGYASDVDQMIERLELDLYYLDNRSFFFDTKIAIDTIGIVFKGKGV